MRAVVLATAIRVTPTPMIAKKVLGSKPKSVTDCVLPIGETCIAIIAECDMEPSWAAIIMS